MRVIHKRWAAQIYGNKLSISDADGKVIYEGSRPEDALCTEERLREIIEIKQKEAKK